MRKIRIVLACIFLLFLVGCPIKHYRHELYVPVVSAEQFAGVGDEFFRHELLYGEDNYAGTVFSGEARMFTLTVVAVNEKLIALQYREFTKPPHGPQRGYRMDDSWIVKDGFNQRYDYETQFKVIRFREYEFQILGIENGRIRYRRVS